MTSNSTGTEGGASVFPAKLFRADPLRTRLRYHPDDLKPQSAVQEDRFCHFVDVLCEQSRAIGHRRTSLGRTATHRRHLRKLPFGQRSPFQLILITH